MSAATRVLIAGSGVAGLEATLALHALAGKRVRLTLLSPSDDFVYRPMAVAEPFGRGHTAHYSVAKLAAAVNAEIVRDRLAAVDTGERVAVTANGTRLPCDVLLVAVGAHEEPALQSAVTWSPDADPAVFGGLLRDVEDGYSKRLAFVAPPGVRWTLPVYELALMTAWRAWSMGQDDTEITVYTPELAPLELLGSGASAAVRRELAEVGVQIRTGVCVFEDALAPGRFIVHSRLPRSAEQPLEAERIVALPQQVPSEIAGLPRDADGFLPVDLHGRVLGSGFVWAAGDVTDFAIKLRGLAAQQADAAAESIAELAGASVRPRPFRPVLRGLTLTGHGERWIGHGLSDGIGDGSTPTEAPWSPPTETAGRYLGPYLTARDRAQMIEANGLPVDLDPKRRPFALSALAGSVPSGSRS